jgi:two-component system response regulator NreC
VGPDIRILLVDDHEVIRQGLRSLLRAAPGMDVVAEAANGPDAVRLAAETAPDAVVMDVNMPGLDGVEATRQIIATAAAGQGAPKVVALSAHAGERVVRDMLKAGASGFVPKHAAFEELADAVRAVVAGRVYLSPAAAGTVAGHVARGGPAVSTLSPREREVLQLTAEGLATKQVAARLSVSVKTVETHRRNLMEKLDIHSVAELTKYAIVEGLTTVDA